MEGSEGNRRAHQHPRCLLSLFGGTLGVPQAFQCLAYLLKYLVRSPEADKELIEHLTRCLAEARYVAADLGSYLSNFSVLL